MRSHALRHVLTHLITPLLMCIGMGLAYMGAFVTPEPNHLPVAVVGSGPEAKVLAQSVKDKAGDDLDGTDRRHPRRRRRPAEGPRHHRGLRARRQGARGRGGHRRVRHGRHGGGEGLHPARRAAGRPAEGDRRGHPGRRRPHRPGPVLPADRGQYRLLRLRGRPRSRRRRPVHARPGPPRPRRLRRRQRDRRPARRTGVPPSPTTISPVCGAWPGCTRRASCSSAWACTPSSSGGPRSP